MGVTDRLYSLVLRVYPRDFRRDREDELLSTLAEEREDGRRRGHLRQIVSLLLYGGRLRWLRGTDGSWTATLRQGLMWGALVQIALNAGALVAKLLWALGGALLGGWGDRFTSIVVFELGAAWFCLGVVLTVCWPAAFLLLASGRRRSGLVALGAAMCLHAAQWLVMAGRVGMWPPDSLSWCSGILLPLSPLFAAWLWPRDHRLNVRLRIWILSLASVAYLLMFGSISVGDLTLYWVLIVAVPLAVAAMGLQSDPRWALATGLAVIDTGVTLALTIQGGDLPSGLLGFVLALILPVTVVLLYARRRRSALMA